MENEKASGLRVLATATVSRAPINLESQVERGAMSGRTETNTLVGSEPDARKDWGTGERQRSRSGTLDSGAWAVVTGMESTQKELTCTKGSGHSFASMEGALR